MKLYYNYFNDSLLQLSGVAVGYFSGTFDVKGNSTCAGREKEVLKPLAMGVITYA